ncbi:MAG: hypothetical protein CVT60_07560 [Actinobacteria bacterium HGW-Actinobacteria-10]|jgi:CheY-like chemotaxis protein|nr:MAG: hypothetical protein CVT60_07560 [Actinobacteria bacterium HGW-Actinobacteria-10]
MRGRMTAKRVLVVDDNRLIRVLVQASLKSLNLEIVEATDGQEGITAAFECRPDLILLDVVMPRMSGFEVLTRLREDPDAPSCPIAMLTTAASEQDHVEARIHGADAYIVKPFDHNELRDTVADLLGV